MKEKIKDIRAYCTGWFRYRLFYSKLNWLIPKHIREQIDIRILSMDAKCFNDGSCKMCGCTTTALQMANKRCDKPCYPEMMSKKEWEEFYKREIHEEKDGILWKRKGTLFKKLS